MSSENYLKVVKERNDLADAFNAMLEWYHAMDAAQHSVYKYDAYKEADAKRELWHALMPGVVPILERRKDGKAE